MEKQELEIRNKIASAMGVISFCESVRTILNQHKNETEILTPMKKSDLRRLEIQETMHGFVIWIKEERTYNRYWLVNAAEIKLGEPVRLGALPGNKFRAVIENGDIVFKEVKSDILLVEVTATREELDKQNLFESFGFTPGMKTYIKFPVCHDQLFYNIFTDKMNTTFTIDRNHVKLI